MQCREVVLQTTIVVNSEMTGHNTLSREGSLEGCNYSRCGGDHGVGGLWKEAGKTQVPGHGGENSGERWFNLENTSAERCSLCHLECELDTSLQFE